MMAYFLFCLFFVFSYAADDEPYNFYQGKISKTADDWTVIESPMRGTGAKVYIKGEKDSEEVTINVERSLASTTYPLMNFFNIANSFLGWCFFSSYTLEEYQLRVILTIAAEMPYYDWGIGETSPLTLNWLLNYNTLELYLNNNPAREENIREKYIVKFKEKFPRCSCINLTLHSMERSLILSEDPAMKTLTDGFKKQKIDFVLNHAKND